MNHYEEKQQARKERYEELAEKNTEKATSSFNNASNMIQCLWGGQPILVGHHSEKGHRALLARSDNAMRRGVELDKKADYYAKKAESVGTGGISGDDPDAVKKLREKLEGLETSQAMMKASNLVIRKYKKDGQEAQIKALMAVSDKITEGVAKELLKGDFCGRIGFASFMLTNNNANIKTVKQRIEKLERESKRAEEGNKEYEIAGVRVLVNHEEKRLQLFFNGKPSEGARSKLKSNGYRWARYSGCWQAYINNRSLHNVRDLLNNLED